MWCWSVHFHKSCCQSNLLSNVQSAKEEVIVEIVDQCRILQRRVMQLVNDTSYDLLARRFSVCGLYLGFKLHSYQVDLSFTFMLFMVL